MSEKCECKIVPNCDDYGSPRTIRGEPCYKIEYCPTHAAAFKNAELIQLARDAFFSPLIEAHTGYKETMLERLREAIQDADEEEG